MRMFSNNDVKVLSDLLQATMQRVTLLEEQNQLLSVIAHQHTGALQHVKIKDSKAADYIFRAAVCVEELDSKNEVSAVVQADETAA